MGLQEKDTDIGDKFLVTKTDLDSYITYANSYFIDICGYSEQELIGKPHNVVRHPDMPKSIFKFLWKELQSGNEFWGYVKNSVKSGGHYWVLAHIIPNFNSAGTKIGYHSNRRLISDNKIQQIDDLYSKIRNQENQGGISAGEDFLQNFLTEKGVSYNEYILSI